MPYYADIKNLMPEMASRTAERLLLLKEKLALEIPQKSEHNLLLATWNIREFDSASFGMRTDEAMLYIAEIVDKFDLIAVQEVRDNLDGLRRLMHLLGDQWAVLFTDVTEGREGNKERMAYIYDKRKVSFGGLSGELVLPEGKQLARSPYVVGFKAGWYRFMVISVHLIYGKKGRNSEERIVEAEQISNFLSNRVDNPTAWTNTAILLGDFNIFDEESDTFKAITEHFYIPDIVSQLPTNAAQNKHFDQIAFKTPFAEELLDENKIKAGVFNFFNYVYTLLDEYLYEDEMGEKYSEKDEDKKSNYYKTYWRTHQMSDHLPLWISLPIDRSQQFLEEIASGIITKNVGGKDSNEQHYDDF